MKPFVLLVTSLIGFVSGLVAGSVLAKSMEADPFFVVATALLCGFVAAELGRRFGLTLYHDD